MGDCQPAIDNGLLVMYITECGFRDRLTLIKLRWVLSNESGKAESRTPEASCLEECMHVAEKDSKALCVACVRVD